MPLLSATIDGGGWDRAGDATAAWYMLAGQVLIHDDIVDADRLRRGRPTLWVRYGIPEAILTGDALVGAAFELLTEVPSAITAPAARMLATATRHIANGQIMDVTAQAPTPNALNAALDMTVAKTCSYLRCGACFGALHTQSGPEQVAAMGQYGHHLGMIMQLRDDLADIWGDPTDSAELLGADLLKRKGSLPVVAALSSTRPERDELARYYQSKHVPDRDELRYLMGLLEICGARVWCDLRIDEELAAAHDCLDRAAPHPQARQHLLDYAAFIARCSSVGAGRSQDQPR
ncbi:polyprenyl synthetase family protein [Nocardia sp. NPDC051321]|uniref:polyprenyl synthetase family protein n=1 Tax=Nocardia sp. NPDC051321 TaxID=3364323 RepID=UPI003795FBF3